jgi:hypothetical protein
MSSALNPYLFHHNHDGLSDFSLSPGQLTSRGFMQHIYLGKLLHSTYQDYFDLLKANDIYVRSTNYLRTIRVSYLRIVFFLRKLNETSFVVCSCLSYSRFTTTKQTRS